MADAALADAASPQPAAGPARGPGGSGPEIGFLCGTVRRERLEEDPAATLPESIPRAPRREPEVSFQPPQPQFTAIALFHAQ